MKKLKILLRLHSIIIFISITIASPGQVPFTPGNIVVYCVGNGLTDLSVASSTAYPTFIREYTPAGVLVQSIPLPIAVNGSNKICTMAGSVSGGGWLTRSVNGQYLVFTGYNGPPGTANITIGNGLERVIGLIDFNATINTSTALTDYAPSSRAHSAVSTNGTDFWAVGEGTTTFVRYATIGSTTSTGLTSIQPAANFTVNITDGQLYTSTGSSTNVRIGAIGSGIPTTPSQAYNGLPGMPTTGQFHQFNFADLDASISGSDVLYIANASAGIQKYSLVGGVWTLNGTVGTSTDAYRGLTTVVTGSNVTIYASRRGTNSSTIAGGDLVSLTDASGYNGAFSGTPTVFGTAPGTANTYSFRGIALAPQAPPACASPSTPLISNIAPNSVTINWNAVSGAIGYEYAVTTSINPPSSGTQTTATSYNVTGLTQGATYFAHVRTNCGSFNFSSWVTTSFIPVCSVPLNLTVTNVGRTADFRWDSVAGAIGYEYAVTTSSAPPTTGTLVNSTVITATGLNAVTQYYAHVRTSCGTGGFSSWMTAPFKTPCFAPIIASLNINTESTIIKWNKIDGAINYQYAILNIPAPPLSGSLTADTVLSTGKFPPGNGYYLHVRTNCGIGGFSEWTTYGFHITGLKAYPNPVKSTLFIQLHGVTNPNGQISIVDMMGRLVRKDQLIGNTVNIDMRGFAVGIYLIRYDDGKNKYILKVMKQ